MPSLAEIKDIFNNLYSSIDGHAISGLARRRKEYDKTLTYGEVTPETFGNILDKVNIKKNEVFYDLGSGTGKAVILASMFGDFSKLYGIELLDELYEVSTEVLKRYEKEIKSKSLADKVQQEIQFLKADFLQYDFSNADVIFAHSTCFSDYMMMSLARKFDSLKKGVRVITVTKWLDSYEYMLLERKEYPFTWGNGTVSIYQKI